jgi:23S rRNA pseudouridine1911/1915/1917 synthase
MDDFKEPQELYEHFRIEVDPGQKLLRIDKFLFNRLEKASRSRIQNAAAAGNILVNEQPVKSNYKVKPGDVITIVLAYPPRELEIIPQDIPLHILFEDDDVIVLLKEAGMTVHPGHGNLSGTLVNALVYHFRNLPNAPEGDFRPGLVHRIDKDTSGVMVVAKNDVALNRLARQFYEHTVERKYHALVWGVPTPEGIITGNVGRDVRDRTKMAVMEDETLGKHAVTHYRLLRDLGYISLVECVLETGRTHQIRVHFKHIGHPLFNDQTYGGDQILRGTVFTKYKQFVQNCFTILPRQALHAKSLGFNHPSTGEWMAFDTSLPDDMQHVIEKWERYLSGREYDK